MAGQFGAERDGGGFVTSVSPGNQSSIVAIGFVSRVTGSGD